MASPALALDSTMVFTLPSNASQALYPHNTVTDFRVALPERVALRSNDYEVTLASFTYAHSWYNVPDLAGQTHTAIFIHRRATAIARRRRQPLLRPRTPQKHHHLILARAQRSSRVAGPLALDTMNMSGKCKTT